MPLHQTGKPLRQTHTASRPQCPTQAAPLPQALLLRPLQLDEVLGVALVPLQLLLLLPQIVMQQLAAVRLLLFLLLLVLLLVWRLFRQCDLHLNLHQQLLQKMLQQALTPLLVLLGCL